MIVPEPPMTAWRIVRRDIRAAGQEQAHCRKAVLHRFPHDRRRWRLPVVPLRIARQPGIIVQFPFGQPVRPAGDHRPVGGPLVAGLADPVQGNGRHRRMGQQGRQGRIGRGEAHDHFIAGRSFHSDDIGEQRQRRCCGLRRAQPLQQGRKQRRIKSPIVGK